MLGLDPDEKGLVRSMILLVLLASGAASSGCSNLSLDPGEERCGTVPAPKVCGPGGVCVPSGPPRTVCFRREPRAESSPADATVDKAIREGLREAEKGRPK